MQRGPPLTGPAIATESEWPRIVDLRTVGGLALVGLVLGLLVGACAGAFLDAHRAIIGGGLGLGASLGRAFLLAIPRSRGDSP